MAKNLTIDMIYEKEFHVDFKGYNAVEVDQFLDLILEDYQNYEKLIQEQTELIKKYEDALNQQKRMLLEYEGRSRIQKETDSVSVNNVDLLRRVSKLEEVVFKNR